MERSYWKPFLIFLFIAYSLLWVFNIIAFLSNTIISENLILYIISHGIGFCPFIGSWFVLRYYEKDEKKEEYFQNLKKIDIPIKWYALAISIPFLTYFITRIIQIYAGAENSLIEATPFDFGITLIIAILLSGIKEEPGWRGYGIPKLIEKYNPIVASIIIGLIWSFWHFLTYLFGSRPLEEFPQFVITLIFLSVIYTWLFIQTRSIPVVIVLHVMHNFWVFTFVDFNPTITIISGGGLVYLIITLVIIFLYGFDLNSYRYKRNNNAKDQKNIEI